MRYHHLLSHTQPYEINYTNSKLVRYLYIYKNTHELVIKRHQMNPSLKIQGGWKQFYTSNGKLVRFYVPLGVKRRRGYCPKCKVWFTLCPLEEKLPIYHHYFCANRCKLTPNGRCQYTAMGLKPPSCGAEIGRIPKC